MKNLSLDIGNVLVYIDFKPFINLLSKNLNITREDVWYFLNRVQKLHDLGLTKMEDELKDHFKIKSPVIIEELLDAWERCLTPNYYLIEQVQKLAEDLKIKIALLSNIGIDHAEWFNSTVKFDNSIKHFSCYVGARKPSMIYYQSFLQQYPEFSQSIYIDDNKDNLITGSKMGLFSHYFNLEDKCQLIECSDIIMSDRLISLIKEHL